MKVILESLRIAPYGGVRTAAIGWIKALAEYSPTTHFIALLSRPITELQSLSNLEQIILPTPGQLLPRLHLQIILPWLVHKHNIDIVHFLRNLAVIVPNAKVVVNVNDLTRLILPETYSKWDILYWQTIQYRVLRYAQWIICISDQTRADVIKWLNHSNIKISTIYPAIHERYRPLATVNDAAIQKKYNLPEKFVLYVGGLAQHKNVRTLIRAFAQLKRSTSLPQKLVIVGGQFHTHNDIEVHDIARELLGNEVIFTGVVPDDDLVILYNKADVFVFPSRYEGFGLVPLEAISCGTPVIASPVGSLPEVLGKAALWVEDPLDEQGYAEAIAQVLENPLLRTEMIQKSIEQAQRFSWTQTARQTINIYQSLLNDNA